MILQTCKLVNDRFSRLKKGRRLGFLNLFQNVEKIKLETQVYERTLWLKFDSSEAFLKNLARAIEGHV